MRWIAALALLVAGSAFGQTCATPTPPQPRDSVFLTWNPVVLWADGSPIADPSRVRYGVYEIVNGLEQRVCVTAAPTAAILGLADGLHTWVVRASSPDSLPTAYAVSGPSPSWSKTIAPVSVGTRPAAPTSLTGE